MCKFVEGDNFVAIPCHLSRSRQIIRQVVTDLGVLRELAEGLLRYDAVTFLQLLDTLRQSEGRAAVWLLHSAAHTIFDYVSQSAERRRLPPARGLFQKMDVISQLPGPANVTNV